MAEREKYTLDEVQYIRSHPYDSDAEIGAVLGRTAKAIKNKRQNLDSTPTAERREMEAAKRRLLVERVASLWPSMTIYAIARALGTHADIVRTIGKELGLPKSNRSQAQYRRQENEWCKSIHALRPKGFTAAQLAWAEETDATPMPKSPDQWRAWGIAKLEAGTILAMAKDDGMVQQ